jgi:hypothetical protein
MNLRPIGICSLVAATLFGATTANSAQSRRRRPNADASPVFTSAASRVTAEIAKGKLSTAESKPGDTVTLKLQDDLRANGLVVLKKGTTFTGVVQTVKRPETDKSQSVLEVEWLVPDVQGKVPQNVSVTLQSVTQSGSISKNQQANAGEDLLAPGRASPLTAAFPQTRRPNNALLSMPTVVAVDKRTGDQIEAELGSTSSQNGGPLYRVGQAQLVSINGSRQAVEIYSHLDNDTVITSSSKDFEITSGAQLLLLVGVNRK